MKRIISQISIILLIMIIGTTFSTINKVFAAVGVNCPSTVTVGENFTVSLTGLTDTVTGYSCDIKVTYADGTTASGNLAYMKGGESILGPNKTSCSFKAKVVGSVKVEILNWDVVGADLAAPGTKTIIVKEEVKPCTHENKKTEVVQNVSCIKDKIEVTKCASCGQEIERKTTEKAKGHSWGETKTTKEATCCEAGSKEKVCTTCSTKETTTIDATGKHTYSGSCKKTKPVNNTTNTTNTNNSKNNTTNTNKVDEEVKMPKFKDVDETVYAKKTCNVRNSCTTKTNNNKIGSLQEGEQLKRTGISDEWSRIIYDGKTAYVATSLLTTEEPVEETNEVENENVVDDEMKAIQAQVGVLPEVGNNIAVTGYFVITLIAIAIATGSLYYINKDNEDVK